MGLLFTLLLGLFIILGAMIVFITKNNDKFVSFSISLAFGVIFMLIITDLLPESYEIIDTGNLVYNIIYITLGAAIGFIFLKILDYFIPDHEEGKKHENENLKHIGMVSSIALVLHNIVEGMAIYLLINSDIKSGIFACIGVGLHNIPMGMVIASTFYNANQNKLTTFFIILSISFSTLIGGILISVAPVSDMLEMIKGISLTITIGMLLYILSMELFPKIIHCKYQKLAVGGVLLGILLLAITIFL